MLSIAIILRFMSLGENLSNFYCSTMGQTDQHYQKKVINAASILGGTISILGIPVLMQYYHRKYCNIML